MNKGTYAEKLFKDGYNCAQAVVGAFCDELNIDIDTAARLTSSFGGGMGRMREVCGAVSGMFAVVGLKLGYSDPKDQEAKKKHYELIQKMAAEFKSHTGSIICREIIMEATDDTPNPTPRTSEFYKKRPCGEYVRIAAEITEKALNNSL